MEQDNQNQNNQEPSASDINLEQAVQAKLAVKLKQQSNSEDNYTTDSAPRKGTNGISIVALVFAFLLPPIGLILAFIARSKSKNENLPTGTSTTALVISLILFLGLLSGGGYYGYRRYKDSHKPKPQTAENKSQSAISSNYTDNEKKAISQSEQFLRYIKSENYSEAFKLFSPELQKEYPGGEADFAKEVSSANLKLIESWSITEATTTGSQGRITVKGDASFKASTTGGKFEFQYYKDSDGSVKMFLWQITPNT